MKQKNHKCYDDCRLCIHNNCALEMIVSTICVVKESYGAALPTILKLSSDHFIF